MTNFARNARLLHLVLSTPKTTIVPIFIGPPGGGKTACVEAVADALGARYLEWIPAQMSPEDFNGWPTPRPEGLVFEVSKALRDANDAPLAILNLDEMSNTPRSTQAAMLRFIHSRRAGDVLLRPSLRICGAMNPPDTSADAQEISHPLANRVCWLPWLPTETSDHVAYILRGGSIEDLGLAPISDDAWHDAFNDVAAIYAAFMERRGDLREDPNAAGVISRFPFAYSTERSWTNFLHVAATCRAAHDEDALRIVAEGTIGKPQALEFMAFYLDADLPSPEAWLKNPKLFTHDSKRPDRTFAATTALALATNDKRKTEKLKPAEKLDRWHRAWDCLQHCLDSKADKTVVALAAQSLATDRPAGALLAHVQKLITEDLAPVIRAAGFTAGTSAVVSKS